MYMVLWYGLCKGTGRIDRIFFFSSLAERWIILQSVCCSKVYSRLVKMRPVATGSPMRERRTLLVLLGSWIWILEYLEIMSTPTVLSSWMARKRPGQACLFIYIDEE